MKDIINYTSPLFSFCCDGETSDALLGLAELKENEEVIGDVKTICKEYYFPKGLVIKQIQKVFEKYNAVEWVLWLENKSEEPTGLITELNDCNYFAPFEYDPIPEASFLPEKGTARIFNPAGSSRTSYEFCSTTQYIVPGQSYHYEASGGRSSQKKAPFFDVNRGEKGIICAIGWTGQWRADFSRDDKHISIKTGVEDVSFRLFPGEKIRTSSTILLSYVDGQDNGHNMFRRLVKEHFSLIGKPGRPKEGPLSFTTYGGMSSEALKEKIRDSATKKVLPYYDYIWVDAGWYGDVKQDDAGLASAVWVKQTGNWNVNRYLHPNGMKDISEEAEKNGISFMLWFEPERAIANLPVPMEHPDWFLHKKNDSEAQEAFLLLDLGNEEAWNYVVDTVTGYIEKLNLGCYRQDFNMNPLDYWRDNDEPERKGLCEIKHIMGLYAFWDTLLDRFPHLIIDNCSSGGQRIDIETARRSIPLWRSDYQCSRNCDAESTQNHNTGISWWLPYSGTGTGIPYGHEGSRLFEDTYRYRSAYSSALSTGLLSREQFVLPDDESKLAWFREMLAEYLKVRPYFSCDFYQLTSYSLDNNGWTVWQYDRPLEKDGIIIAFRRPDCPCGQAVFDLGGINPDKSYSFTCDDTDEKRKLTSKQLSEFGFYINIKRKRSSVLWFYNYRGLEE